MKVLYVCATGPSDQTRSSIPFHLAANGSVEVGQEASIVLGGDAVELILEGKADEVEGVGLPPLRELLAKIKDHSVPVYV